MSRVSKLLQSRTTELPTADPAVVYTNNGSVGYSGLRVTKIEQAPKVTKEQYYADAEVKASLAWEMLGVSVEIKTARSSFSGKDKTLIDLTAAEALTLAQQLISAAQAALELDISYRDHLIDNVKPLAQE